MVPIFLKLGIHDLKGLMPIEIFALFPTSIVNFVFTFVGGLFIGFGTRWANGCTAGHTIMGLALLNPVSLLASIGFFVGGLIATHFIIPFLLIP
jgi:uncharacterized membrane protein YedE/YeeE